MRRLMTGLAVVAAVGLFAGSGVVLVYTLRKKRHIHTGVRFAGDPESARLLGGVLGEERTEDLEVGGGRRRVVPHRARGVTDAPAKPDTRGLLPDEKACLCRPRVRVRLEEGQVTSAPMAGDRAWGVGVKAGRRVTLSLWCSPAAAIGHRCQRPRGATGR